MRAFCMAKSVATPTFSRHSIGDPVQLSPTPIGDPVQLFRDPSELHPRFIQYPFLQEPMFSLFI